MPNKESSSFLHRYIQSSTLKNFINFLKKVKKASLQQTHNNNNNDEQKIQQKVIEIENDNIDCWEKAIILKNFYNNFIKVDDKINTYYTLKDTLQNLESKELETTIQKTMQELLDTLNLETNPESTQELETKLKNILKLKTSQELETPPPQLQFRKQIEMTHIKERYQNTATILEDGKNEFGKRTVPFPFLILPKPINTFGELLAFPLYQCHQHIKLDSQYSKNFIKHMSILEKYNVFKKVEVTTGSSVLIIYEPNLILLTYSLNLLEYRKNNSFRTPMISGNLDPNSFVSYKVLGYTHENKIFNNIVYNLNDKFSTKIKDYNSKSTQSRRRKKQQIEE